MLHHYLFKGMTLQYIFGYTRRTGRCTIIILIHVTYLHLIFMDNVPKHRLSEVVVIVSLF